MRHPGAVAGVSFDELTSDDLRSDAKSRLQQLTQSRNGAPNQTTPFVEEGRPSPTTGHSGQWSW